MRTYEEEQQRTEKRIMTTIKSWIEEKGIALVTDWSECCATWNKDEEANEEFWDEWFTDYDSNNNPYHCANDYTIDNYISIKMKDRIASWQNDEYDTNEYEVIA